MKKEYENFANYNLSDLSIKEIASAVILHLMFLLMFCVLPYHTVPFWAWGYLLCCIVVGALGLLYESMWMYYLYRAVAFGGGSLVFYYLSYLNLSLVVVGFAKKILPYVYGISYVICLIIFYYSIKKLIKKDAYAKKTTPFPSYLGYMGGTLAMAICPMLFSSVITGESQFAILMAFSALFFAVIYSMGFGFFYKAFLLRKLEKQNEK